MALTDAQRARYARHLLLPELGQAGQERLLEACVHFPSDADGGASAVARSYLERAGVSVGDKAEGSVEVELVDEARCAELAGRPELMEAARALAGAFQAVEAIKALAGIGSRGVLGATLRLAAEEV